MVWSGETFSKRRFSDGWIRVFQIIFHKYSISQESNVTNLFKEYPESVLDTLCYQEFTMEQGKIFKVNVLRRHYQEQYYHP